MNRDILSKIEQEQMISREELEELLTTTDQELIEELYRRARATAGKYYGKEIDPRSSAAFQQSHLCRRFLDLERNITKLFQDLYLHPCGTCRMQKISSAGSLLYRLDG